MVQSRTCNLIVQNILVINLGTEEAMKHVHNVAYVSLHVRKSNRAAFNLYNDSLGFSVHEIEKGYCERGFYV